MKRVPQEQLHPDLAGAELPGQPPERHLVGVGRGPEGQLFPELLGQLTTKAERRAVVDPEPLLGATGQVLAQLVVRYGLHPHEDAARSIARSPLVDQWPHAAPSAEIDVPDAEVGAAGEGEGLLEGREELGGLREVVEDARHGGVGGARGEGG